MNVLDLNLKKRKTMRTESITIYKFDELSEKAKEKAIEWYRSDGFNYEWWDAVYEDAKEIGKIMGITIERIFFSGFWSQGDGACFEGSYKYEVGSVKNLKAYAPQDKMLHQIAIDLSKAQQPAFYKLFAIIKQQGTYLHEMSTVVETHDMDEICAYDVVERLSEDITEALRDFMRWIYRSLKKEYEWLSGNEQITETIRRNAYEFTINGELYIPIKAVA